MVYDLCKNQLILTPMGDILGIRLEAIKTAMDLLKIQRQVETAQKIIIFVSELYKKE
ncbi:MAG: hypothetical protein ABIL39_11550 [candidate division WOR-3 bacterium]